MLGHIFHTQYFYRAGVFTAWEIEGEQEANLSVLPADDEKQNTGESKRRRLRVFSGIARTKEINI